MKTPVPSPRATFIGLLAMTGDGVSTARQLVGIGPRLLTLVTGAEELLARVEVLVGRIEGTQASAELVVGDAGRVSTDAALLVDRIRALTDKLEPSITLLEPTLAKLAASTDPSEVDALVFLVDHLPVVVDSMEKHVLPMLDSLGSVAPDLHELLDISRELNEMLARIPGMGRIKRRLDAQSSETT